MDEQHSRNTSAEVVVACDDLSATLEFFTDHLGFQLEMITPADSPRVAVIVGYGIRLRLDTEQAGSATAAAAAPEITIRIAGDSEMIERLGSRSVAPNGTVIEVVAPSDGPTMPTAEPAFEICRFADSGFETGRAGMGYRDLLPARQGGRYIASHIRIPDAGPVPDYVHYHRIRFQMIYCRRGWARLVYEDQGPPFLFEAGDCVLQPPEIRHRVLESSAGLEVVEIGCPAEHETLTDPGLPLPNDVFRPERRFGDQLFVRHVAAQASWSDDGNGLICRELGVAAATGGMASARVIRTSGPPAYVAPGDDLDLHFLFICEGEADLAGNRLAAGDAFTLPSGSELRVDNLSPDFEALQVTVTADQQT